MNYKELDNLITFKMGVPVCHLMKLRNIRQRWMK